MIYEKYKNRYNDIIEFSGVEGYKVYMKGGEYYRFASLGSSLNKLSMTDPSGGPYISRGSNMGRFNQMWEGFIVDYIVPSDGNSFTIHLLRGRVHRGQTNGVDEIRWYPENNDGSYEVFEDIDQLILKYGTNE